MDRAGTTFYAMLKKYRRARIRKTANATADKVTLSSASPAPTPDALNRTQEILGSDFIRKTPISTRCLITSVITAALDSLRRAT